MKYTTLLLIFLLTKICPGQVDTSMNVFRVETPENTMLKKYVQIQSAAKAHPELLGDGIWITFNVNSLDFGELLENAVIYFPKFVWLKIKEKS